MNIYALRDRLIDYCMQPFVGPDDKNTLASVARLINSGELTSDIAQAPHHFEVWKLGAVTEDGHLVAERELIADCASLIRPGIRQGGATGDTQATRAAEGSRGPTMGPGSHGRAPNGTFPSQAPTEDGPGSEVRRGPQGGYPPRGDA